MFCSGYPAISLGVAFALTAGGGLPLLFATIGKNSPGAVDNASGVGLPCSKPRALSRNCDDIAGILITRRRGSWGWRALMRVGFPWGAHPVSPSTATPSTTRVGISVLWGVRRPGAALLPRPIDAAATIRASIRLRRHSARRDITDATRARTCCGMELRDRQSSHLAHPAPRIHSRRVMRSSCLEGAGDRRGGGTDCGHRAGAGGRVNHGF